MQTETDFTEFDFVSQPSFPEAVLPDAAALQALRDFEQEMPRVACALPESAASDFPAPMMTVVYSAPKISLAAARAAAASELAQAMQTLPRGAKPERVAETLRPVFVPRWFLKGQISSHWRASGIVTETWESDCPQCFGSGRMGVGTNQRECEGCWGGGKQKQTRKDKHDEQGDVAYTLLDSLDNNGTGVALELSPVHAEVPWLLPDEERSRLHCLRPAGVYSSTALDVLKNRLAARMEAQVRDRLKQYSRIESFMFEPESVCSQSAVAAWLYPAYLGLFPVPGATGYVVCDGLSGKANWALGLATESDQVATNATRVPIIAGGLAAAATAGALAWYFFAQRG
ncbi:MAG: hypothetical protein KBD60_05395 [Sterolibacterium sp.]|nr:hypothetical protein [Sterolibacterium sp.]